MGKQKNILLQSEAMYQQLIEVYPNDSRFLRKYVDILHLLEKTEQAHKHAEKLHALLLDSGEMDEAKELEKNFPFLTGHEEVIEAMDASFLSFLDDSLLGRALMKLKETKLKENEYLFRSGDLGTSMFLVLEGSLVVMKKNKPNQKPVVLNMLNKGDIVGELAMFRNEPRSADVVASKPCRLFELSRQHLSEILGKSEHLNDFFKKQSETRRRVTHISRNPLLARLPLKTRRRIAEAATPFYAKSSALICEKDCLIKDVRLLTKGVANVMYEDRRGNHHLLNSVQTNDLIGEYAILKKESYPVDIVASTHVEWLSIPLPLMLDIALAYPNLKMQLEHMFNKKETHIITMVQKLSTRRELD